MTARKEAQPLTVPAFTSTRLTAAYDRARLTVRSSEASRTAEHPQSPEAVDASLSGAAVQRPQPEPQAPSRPPQRRAALVPPVTVRPVVPDLSVVRVQRPAATVPTAPALADVAPLDDLADGPRRLLELLHRLALDDVRRRFPLIPSQHVIHQSQQLVAAALGADRVSVWRWTKVLRDRGLLAAKPHVTTTTHRGRSVNRTDGTLYAVPLQAGKRPRVPWEYLKLQWRDLDADRKAGKTAYQTLQQSDNLSESEWYQVLLNWCVSPGSTGNIPLEVSDCCTALKTVQHVADALPLVAQAHPSKRAALVDVLGAALARLLRDEHSHRWYCGLIWEAWRAERELRPGLAALGDRLRRLESDRHEWDGLRNPGALLVKRERQATA